MSVDAKIKPTLWYPGTAKEAADFYVSVFPNSSIGQVQHYTEAGKEHHGMEAGAVMVVDFTLNGQKFSALNGPDIFKFNEAVSFTISCEDQAEVDHYATKLIEGGGKTVECGWVRDRFGLAWQVIPKQLGELMGKGSAAQKTAVMNAMLSMKTQNIEALQKAFDEAA